MNKITVNQLKPVEKINADKILQDYDLFEIRVQDDFYPYKEALLSVNKSEDGIAQKIVALDYSYHDGNKTVYCLCRKNMVSSSQLRQALIKYSNKIYNPRKLNEAEVIQVPQAALLQLFFNQVIDQNVLEGSSLTGKLYLLGSSSSNSKENTLNIDEFSLDNDLVARIATHCFSQIKKIDSDRLKKLKGKPRFRINKRTKQIKLAGRGKENENYYIIAPPVRNEKPDVTKFLKIPSHNHYATFVKSKSGMLYRLLDVFNQQFGQYFSPLAFKEIEVESRQLDKSQYTETEKLKEKIEAFSNEHPIALTDIDGDNNNTIEDLAKTLKKLNIKIVSSTKASLKLAVDHNAKYYSTHKLHDPYHSSWDTQHITVENLKDLSSNTLNATLYSSVKELMIKNDLKKHSISLVDKPLSTQFTFFQKFEQDNDEIVLQFRFLPNNQFEIKKVDDLDNPFSKLAIEEDRSIELIIKDERSNTYFKIERTNKNTLPNVEFYDDMVEFTNHDKTPIIAQKDLLKASKSLNDAKFDPFIKLIESDKQDQYSASEVTKKLNEAQISDKTQSKLVAVLTEKYDFIISINSRSDWARDRYLNGLTDINYYQKENAFYYNVGVIGKGMNTSITRGSIIRKISPIELLNENASLSSKDIFNLISTMLVTFVKYTDLTVLPFPEKYLNEYYRLILQKSGD